MNDEVDILLATYNGEEFVAEQIESIMKQTHQKIFLIVGDDASRDSTPDIIFQYAQKNRGKFLFQQYHDNVGVILNFSRLSDLSSAPYIMLSDQDDVWLPTKIEETLKKMKEMEAEFGEETPLLVHTNLSVVDSSLKILNPSFSEYSGLAPHRKSLAQVLIQNNALGCTMLINKALLDIAFPIPQEAYMHDYWLTLVATVFGKIGYVNKSTIYYRQHSQNSIGAYQYTSLIQILSLFKDQTVARGHTRKLYAKMIQAYVFYKRYHNMLGDEDKEILEKFITLKNSSTMEEFKTCFRYGFHRGGFYRGLYDMISRYLYGPIPEKYKLKI
jgi:glycosyltransferase involved in cell wall biosynthesis